MRMKCALTGADPVHPGNDDLHEDPARPHEPDVDRCALHDDLDLDLDHHPGSRDDYRSPDDDDDRRRAPGRASGSRLVPNGLSKIR